MGSLTLQGANSKRGEVPALQPYKQSSPQSLLDENLEDLFEITLVHPRPSLRIGNLIKDTAISLISIP